jgi:aldose 1-epimerase
VLEYTRTLKRLALAFVLVGVCAAEQYSATKTVEDGVTAVHLRDAERDIEVTVVPAFGDRVVRFAIHGKNIVYFPFERLSDFAAHPSLNGLPFLAPWANRLDASAYWVNGKQYRLNPALHNYEIGNSELPIHGLLQDSPLWEISEIASDEDSATVTCRLPFWKYPELMAQWPFAEDYEITYRLSNGTLEVRATIQNRSAEAVPVVIGFHPYFRIPDQPRDNWILHIPARKSIVADSRLIPTGELIPLQFSNTLPLRDRKLDNGVTDLERNASGRARFLIEAGDEKIEITFGPNYRVAVLWEPLPPHGPQSEFVGVEPMTAPTDAINLAHEGKYNDLQSVPASGSWVESFWIRPIGF